MQMGETKSYNEIYLDTASLVKLKGSCHANKLIVLNFIKILKGYAECKIRFC